MNVRAYSEDRLHSIDLSDVAEFLPHTGNMILLNKIIEFHHEGLTAEFLVRGDGLLGGDQLNVPAWAGIEYMAQAIAAYIGVQSILAGEPIKLGYLLGTRRYTGNVATFPVNATLTVTINLIMKDDKLGVFECLIKGENIEVTATLNVYQPPTDIILKAYAG